MKEVKQLSGLKPLQLSCDCGTKLKDGWAYCPVCGEKICEPVKQQEHK